MHPVPEQDVAIDEGKVQARLSDTLFGNPVSIVIGSLVGIVAAALVAYQTMSHLMWSICATLVGVSVWRTWIVVGYRADPFRLANVRSWERRFAVAAWTFAALLGAASLTAFVTSDDTVVHMFLVTTVTGFVCTIAARNAARPYIVAPQVVGIFAPVAIGLAIASNPIYWILAVLSVIQIYSLIDLSRTMRNRYREAFVSTERVVAANAKLEERQALIETAFENMHRGFALVRDDGILYECNDRLLEMFGIDRARLSACFSVGDVVHEAHLAGTLDAGSSSEMATAFLSDNSVEVRLTVVTNVGRVLDVHREPTGERQHVLTVEDVTTEWQAKQDVQLRATTDAMTGLGNRSHVLGAIAAAKAERPDCPGAVLFLDLDGFKSVNDLHGHAVGDALLVEVASVLRGCVRTAGDVIGRIGGDEFVVFAPGLHDRAEVSEVADRLIRAVVREHQVCGRGVRVGMTIGVAFLGSADGVEAVLANADMALHDAKNNKRRGTVSFFEPEMKSNVALRVALEQGLRDTLARGGDELSVVYQPIIDIRTRRHVGCEALVRWKHPVLKETTPDKFIPVAEESLLIVALGEWVLRTACAEAATWPGSWRVAVNLSAVQFLTGDIVATVAAVLAETGLSPSRLEVEFTESTLVNDADKTAATVQRLKDLGVRVSLDDFGTGYSSLSYIHKLSFDKIKVDKAFIDNLEDDALAKAIVSSVVAIAGTKDLSVVAEGVETEGQLEALRALGVREVQGYLFSRPLPAAEFRQRYAAPAKLVAVA